MPPDEYAKPGTFDEAVRWFRNRIPVTEPMFRRFTKQERERSFYVANAANLDTANTVWKAIEDALTQGTTFEDFKSAVTEKLDAEWGDVSSGRLETIFRSNIQSAYSAGRYEMETQPAVKKARPYRQFIALLDSRTTPICRPLNGVIKEQDDEFWETRYPPLHPNCRSTTRLLSEEEARGRGFTEDAPTVSVPEGWGLTPTPDNTWTPDLRDYPMQLRKAFPKMPKGTPPSSSGAPAHPGE